MTIDLRKMTPSTRRLVLGSYVVSQQPVRLTMNAHPRHRMPQVEVELVGVGQATDEADEWSQRGSLLVCRFYRTKQLVCLPLDSIVELEEVELLLSDPNHPDYQQEETVVTPIPREALAGRKKGGINQHHQG